MLIRSWNVFHGNTNPPGRREPAARRWSGSPPPTGRTCSASRRCRSGRCRGSPRWSGMTRALGRDAGGRWLPALARRRDHAAEQRPLPLGARRAGERDPARAASSSRSSTARLRIDARPARAAVVPRRAARAARRREPPRDERLPAPELAGRRDRAGARRFVDRSSPDGLPCVLAGDFNAARASSLRELPGWSALGPGNRPRARARPRRAPLASGRSERRRHKARALRSRAGRGDGRMTFDEARALFPVLERVAYLNAGTFGPLARPTLDAMASEQRAELEHGRIGTGVLRADARAARARCAPRSPALVGVEPEQVALTGSTTDGCNIVLAGLEPRPGGRGRHDRRRALRPPRARCTRAGARVVVVAAGAPTRSSPR